MTKFFSVAIFAIILQASLVLAWPDCATNDPEDLTFYPMPECNQFYQCVNGEQAVFTCQDDLVFNFEQQYCDYPENVDCENQGGGSTETTEEPEVTEEPEEPEVTEDPESTDEPVTNHPACGSEDDLTFYPMPECNQFYQCIGGQQHVFTCQEGLVFNFEKQVCDYPENVDCENQGGGSSETTEEPEVTEEPENTDAPATNNPECGSEEDLTFYPMPECDQFYQCVDGIQYVFTCQEGLVFNFELQGCDYPENVEC